jgi:hypothetical protein
MTAMESALTVINSNNVMTEGKATMTIDAKKFSENGDEYTILVQYRSINKNIDIWGDDESLHNLTVSIRCDGSRITCAYDFDIQWNHSDMAAEAWFRNEYAMAPWLEGVLCEYLRYVDPA